MLWDNSSLGLNQFIIKYLTQYVLDSWFKKSICPSKILVTTSKHAIIVGTRNYKEIIFYCNKIYMHERNLQNQKILDNLKNLQSIIYLWSNIFELTIIVHFGIIIFEPTIVIILPYLYVVHILGQKCAHQLYVKELGPLLVQNFLP